MYILDISVYSPYSLPKILTTCEIFPNLIKNILLHDQKFKNFHELNHEFEDTHTEKTMQLRSNGTLNLEKHEENITVLTDNPLNIV